jgi:hypothetical protein
MGKRKAYIMFWKGKPEKKSPLGRPRRRWEIILRWIFRKWGMWIWAGSSWLRIEAVGGHL